jgi:hypothetical protein
MHTKWMFLSAAIIAAIGVSASAATFSVNAVGYVNVQLDPGFNLVSNPLRATDNTIAALYRNITPSIPPGLKVFAFDTVAGGFAQAASYRGAPFNRFDPPASGSITVNVGEGVFLFDPRAVGCWFRPLDAHACWPGFAGAPRQSHTSGIFDQSEHGSTDRAPHRNSSGARRPLLQIQQIDRRV